MNYDPGKERVVLVEYADYDGVPRPFSVVTMDDDGYFKHYDFCWSKHDGTLYFDDCGGGLYLEHSGQSPFWVDTDDDFVLGEFDEMLANRELHSDWVDNKLPAPLPAFPVDRLFADAEERRAVFCNVCEDFLPWQELGDVCDHVLWCEAHGYWSGPGYDGGCDCHAEAEPSEGC